MISYIDIAAQFKKIPIKALTIVNRVSKESLGQKCSFKMIKMNGLAYFPTLSSGREGNMVGVGGGCTS